MSVGKTGYLLQTRKRLNECYPKLNLLCMPVTSTNLDLNQLKYDSIIYYNIANQCFSTYC